LVSWLGQANIKAQHVDRNHSPQYQRNRTRYASDVTKAEWVVIEPHLPAAQPSGAHLPSRLKRTYGGERMHRL